ncbi:MAG: class I SAM-dependent methyltransferase, partial [Candidatus Paceibacterota bacterium]
MSNNLHEIKDKKLFNEIAGKYFLKDVYPVSSRARKFQLLSLFDLYKNETKKEEHGVILELGCGVGASSKYLGNSYKKYIGVDYSEEFIGIAKKHFANNRTLFHCANIKDYKNEFEEVDFIFGVGVLHHVNNIEEVLINLKEIGNKRTVYGFIEPQASNPFIQILRRLRMLIDKDYSSEQIFFKRNKIREIFELNGFNVLKIKYQGYFTVPFAQIIIKPAFLFKPIVNLLIHVDMFIQYYLNNRFSWNIIWIDKL